MGDAKGTVILITEYVNWYTYNSYTYTFNGNSYFTGSGNVQINLPTREGYTRTWRATKTFERPTLSDGTQYYDNITGTTYNVYISSATVLGVTVYVNTDWVFLASDTIKQYRLTYTLNGGTLEGGTPARNHNYGATITLPTTKTKTGYRFKDFTKDEVIITGTSFSLPASDTTVTANWTINQYTLTYTPNGGTLSDGTAAGNHNYGATITLPTTKQKTGYTFNYFTKNGVRTSGTSFSLPASNTTVTAIWTINQYTVTYSNIPDHFDFTSTPSSYDYNTLLTDTIITIPIPRVIGEVYSFEKWTYNSSDLGESRLPAENINLVANWTSTDKDEIQMSELSTVFDNSSSFQNIKISNYFDRLKLDEPIDRENVDFLSKLKGRGTF